MTALCPRQGSLVVLLLATALCGVAGVSLAQDSDAPVIELPVPEDMADTAPTPETDPTPETGPKSEPLPSEPDSGLIRLPPPAATIPEAEGPADSPEPAAEPPAIPVLRDRGAGSAVDGAGWLIRSLPARRLPEGVLMGASLSAPGIVRLTGETAEVELVLDLPPASETPDSLQLTLRSSVNVLPEQASMQITVNDAEPVAVPLDRLGDFASIEVPTDALVAGSNRIALNLRQPHRIFCGPEASFGVWTEIDLTQTGVLVPDAALKPDAAGFAIAARSETSGGRSILLLTDETTDPALVRRVSEQLSRVLGPGARVAQGSFYGLGQHPIASIALISSDAPRAWVRQGASRGLVLQIEYLDDALPDLTPFLAAFPPAPPVTEAEIRPGVKTPISELGSGDVIGNTHYFRRDITFALPTDWLLMANQKARLDLSYGFARGLPSGAILLVKVNDETIRLLPLDEEGGEILPVPPVGFNANLLHPGQNTLSFEMMVPGNPPEGACPVMRADMLVVLDESSLIIPPSPSMVLPGLVTALLRLDPAGVVAPEDAVERDKLESEATQIAAELAPAAEVSTLVRLQVVGLGDFGLVPFEETGLSLTAVQRVLFPRAPEPDTAAATVTATPTPAAPTFSLTDEAEEPLPVEEPSAASEFVSDLWENLSPRSYLEGELRALRDSAFVGTAQSLPAWLEGRSGQALLLRPEFEQRGELWLMLGPGVSAAEVGSALNRLREDSLAQGEAALLQADGSWQIWNPIRPPRLLVTPDAGELRTALGNYASWSPLLFTLAMLGLALVSAVPALLYVLLSRRKGMGL